MRILITGATGLLGKALIETAGRDLEILGTYIGDYQMTGTEKVKYCKVDMADDKSVKKVFGDFKPEVVIHAASIGSPDFAEKHRDLTWEINVNGTSRAVSCCESIGAKFIYISSNGIYDGDHAPYGEDDHAEPVNFYGKTKLEGEIITRKSGIKNAVIRPILMYGWNHPFERGNIVTMALDKLKNNKPMSAYDDVYCNPLYVSECARCIWKVISSGKYESYNIAGKDRVSIYGLLVKVAEVFGLDSVLLTPVKQGYFNELVKRPADTSYRTDKIQKDLGIEPLCIVEGLKRMKGLRR